MDVQNLSTASVYINNLLLSRGLLRNGRPIDFAKPGNDQAGTEATMAKVINLVHDLVLRRDREADQRESLATTVRSLRTVETKQGLEIERFKTQNTELMRSLSLAEGQERAFKSTLRNAEASARSLREQMLRMKSTLQQVRTQCANDIRKRDIQMQKLKQHLTGMQRGRREGLGVSTITVTPLPSASGPTRTVEGGEGLDSPEYSLKQETTEFLTGLCQNLSDENDCLIGLARNTIETLRSLQGLPLSPLLTGSHRKEESGSGETESLGSSEEHDLVTAPLTSYESLASELERVLEHLRTLLTNPSFVPIEALEARDDEIVRLREGWLTMEGRWKEAVIMMDGWRKRMVDGGDSVNIDELKVGLDLGHSIAIGRPAHLDLELADLSTESGIDGDLEEDHSKDTASTSSPEDLWRNQDKPSVKTSAGRDRGGKALGETNGNVSKIASPRKVSFKTSPGMLSEAASDDADMDEMVLLETSKAETLKAASSTNGKSRIPRQISPPMTVSQKLAAVEVEATIAEQQRKQSRSEPQSQPSKSNRKGRGRRRSTLSPEELEVLMGIHD